jgi:predicted acylesterase/phospholipase RssA
MRVAVKRRARWVLGLALLLGGCFAQVRELPPLATKPTFAPIPEASPDLLVGLAISGGGSRAAARFLHGMTFSELYERERAGDSPRIIFNGTSYNSGRRFALTTLPAADFDYDFVAGLLRDLIRRSDRVTAEGQAIIQANLEQARTQFLPLTFEQLGADHRDLPISLAMVSSASFPPAVGPVTYGIGGQSRYEHVGDGGLFDNLGTESLATFFLKKIPRGSSKRGLIIVIDAAFPFDANQAFLDGNRRGFQVFRNDPSRIVGIMEERANAYQLMLWDALRTQGIILPDFANLRVEVLRHTEPEWGVFGDLPAACHSAFSADVTAKAIKESVSQIPTRFQVSPCNAALMIQAAQKVVALHRKRIVDFLERTR